ncbi:hypothetical protein T439DRAFT_320803 [Meredithblackwellia eburnea MCA 4105]
MVSDSDSDSGWSCSDEDEHEHEMLTRQLDCFPLPPPIHNNNHLVPSLSIPTAPPPPPPPAPLPPSPVPPAVVPLAQFNPALPPNIPLPPLPSPRANTSSPQAATSRTILAPAPHQTKTRSQSIPSTTSHTLVKKSPSILHTTSKNYPSSSHHLHSNSQSHDPQPLHRAQTPLSFSLKPSDHSVEARSFITEFHLQPAPTPDLDLDLDLSHHLHQETVSSHDSNVARRQCPAPSRPTIRDRISKERLSHFTDQTSASPPPHNSIFPQLIDNNTTTKTENSKQEEEEGLSSISTTSDHVCQVTQDCAVPPESTPHAQADVSDDDEAESSPVDFTELLRHVSRPLPSIRSRSSSSSSNRASLALSFVSNDVNSIRCESPSMSTLVVAGLDALEGDDDTLLSDFGGGPHSPILRRFSAPRSDFRKSYKLRRRTSTFEPIEPTAEELSSEEEESFDLSFDSPPAHSSRLVPTSAPSKWSAARSSSSSLASSFSNSVNIQQNTPGSSQQQWGAIPSLSSDQSSKRRSSTCTATTSSSFNTSSSNSSSSRSFRFNSNESSFSGSGHSTAPSSDEEDEGGESRDYGMGERRGGSTVHDDSSSKPPVSPARPPLRLAKSLGALRGGGQNGNNNNNSLLPRPTTTTTLSSSSLVKSPRTRLQRSGGTTVLSTPPAPKAPLSPTSVASTFSSPSSCCSSNFSFTSPSSSSSSPSSSIGPSPPTTRLRVPSPHQQRHGSVPPNFHSSTRAAAGGGGELDTSGISLSVSRDQQRPTTSSSSSSSFTSNSNSSPTVHLSTLQYKGTRNTLSRPTGSRLPLHLNSGGGGGGGGSSSVSRIPTPRLS